VTTTANTVTGMVENSGSIDTGQTELGSGVYYSKQKDSNNICSSAWWMPMQCCLDQARHDPGEYTPAGSPSTGGASTTRGSGEDHLRGRQPAVPGRHTAPATGCGRLHGQRHGYRWGERYLNSILRPSIQPPDGIGSRHRGRPNARADKSTGFCSQDVASNRAPGRC
jgi:hypothetical protein